MSTKDNNDMGTLGTTEAVAAYEEAMKEFATSAAQFLEHVALLSRTRDAYQRALAVSTRLRDALNAGDDILKGLMAKVDQAVMVQPGKDLPDKTPSETEKGEARKASAGKSEAARA